MLDGASTDARAATGADGCGLIQSGNAVMERTRRRAASLAGAIRAAHYAAKILFFGAFGIIILVSMASGSCHHASMNSGDASTPSHNASPHGLDRLKDPAVVVEKSARRLTLLDGGSVVKIYPVICGSKSGDKVREGDRRTPEGRFYVCYKNPESLFTLSLGLSYPNEEDAARGLRDGLITHEQHQAIVQAIQANGMPPWDTPLGGEIMIHGCSDGRSATAGCVAMSDDAIRELYGALPLGAPVTIVP